jgi:hypothetical protein
VLREIWTLLLICCRYLHENWYTKLICCIKALLRGRPNCAKMMMGLFSKDACEH